MPLLLVTFTPEERGRRAIAEALEGAATPVYLQDVQEDARRPALAEADAVLARNTARELRPGEARLLRRARLIQFVNAGLDFVPLGELPAEVPVASNRGAYADPIAEHALALALAGAKRLIAEHEAMRRGEFNQRAPNRSLAGAVCGILGFGGIGQATARLMRAIGMRIHAVNRRGRSEEPVEWIGTPERLPEMLAAADVLVVSAPLTAETRGHIGARELGAMKSDAILVNVARGEIVDQHALYAHLRAHPSFFACFDAWWVEPVRHDSFRLECPFFELPNFVGSPHNAATVPGVHEAALRRAVANIRRALAGEAPGGLLAASERQG